MGIALGLLHKVDLWLAPSLCPACGMECAPASPSGQLCAHCTQQLPLAGGEGSCTLCGAPANNATGICRECLVLPRPWFRGTAPFRYQGLAGELMRRYKYFGHTELAPFFARGMALAWQQRQGPSRPAAIIPIPLHWLRRIQRGFNQSLLLAEFLGRELSLPVITPLKRPRSTGHQARLDARERLKNLRKAFVAEPKAVAGKSLLLLDDVFTTGATLSAAAEALLAAGAAEVSVITAARA